MLWMYCIYDTPAKHPRILNAELTLIQENVNVSFITAEKERKKIIPWKSMFLSLPMWAIAVAKFCGAWGNLMLMSKLPAYLESVLHMPIEMVFKYFLSFNLYFSIENNRQISLLFIRQPLISKFKKILKLINS